MVVLFDAIVSKSLAFSLTIFPSKSLRLLLTFVLLATLPPPPLATEFVVDDEIRARSSPRLDACFSRVDNAELDRADVTEDVSSDIVNWDDASSNCRDDDVAGL